MRRFLAFIFGMIFGMVFLLGAIGAAAYIAVAVVRPNQIIDGSDKYIGDFADMSILDMIKNVYKLYNDKLGNPENGKYYSLGEFLATYHINVKDAFGIDLPQDVLDIPMFEFFNKDSDEFGSSGMERAFKQIKVSAIPAVANIFAKGESGDGIFTSAAIEKLSAYSVYDLLSKERGINYVFQDVTFADILPSSFPAEDSDNKLMWAVGQSRIGKLLAGVSGSDNIFGQVHEGGAFEELGKLPLLSIVGESDILKAALGVDTLVSDIVNEKGDIDLDAIVDGISLGELLGCQRNEIEDVTDYETLFTDPDDETAPLIKFKDDGNGSTSYVKNSNGRFYEAEISCGKDEHKHTPDCEAECETEEHEHNADCFATVWYQTQECSKTEHEADQHAGDLVIDGKYYPRASSLYAILANTTVSEITSGSSDALIDKFTSVKVGELLGEDKLDGVMAGFSDLTVAELMGGAIDGMYLGTFFGFKRIDLSNEDLVTGGTAIKLYETGEETPSLYMIKGQNGVIALSSDRKEWYSGELVCETAEGEEENGVPHEHNADCYGFIWFRDKECANTEADHNHETDDLTENGKYYPRADGLEGKLANKQIKNINNMSEEVKDFTLADVFGEDGVPDILNSIAHAKLGNLNDAINDMYLGGLLGFERTEENLSDALTEALLIHELTADETSQETLAYLTGIDGTLYMSDDRKVWYKAKKVCANEAHGENHFRKCYAYAWINKNNEEEIGMMLKMADKKVKDLSELNDTVMTFTLLDIFKDEEKIPAMLRSLKNVEIGELGKEADKLYIGDILKNKRLKKDPSGYENLILEGDNPVVKVTGPQENAAYIKTDDGKMWYEAELTCENSSVTHVHDASCFEYVWYAPCANEDHSLCENETVIDGEPYKPLSGVTKFIVNIRVGEMDSKNLTDAINDMTLGDVINIDGETNQIIKVLAGKKISQLGREINNVYLGSAMNYRRNEIKDLTDYELVAGTVGVFQKTVDGNTVYVKFDSEGGLFEAEMTCRTRHTHGDECFEYVWYEECKKADHSLCENEINIEGKPHVKVSGVSKAFVNAKLNTVGETMNGLTLRKLDIAGDNNIIKAVQDVPIKSIGNEINVLSMGVVLGYEKKQANVTIDDLIAVAANKLYKDKPENGSNYYLYETDGNGNAAFYYASLNCLEAHNEMQHTPDCYGFVWQRKNNANEYEDVKGLNAKIANVTVGGIAGGDSLTKIAKSLTIGDLIDSGMMSVGGTENEYKFAIIFCGDTSHNCSLEGYFTYAATEKLAGRTPSAQAYWEATHTGGTDTAEHRNQWKDLKLSEFISKLLSVI